MCSLTLLEWFLTSLFNTLRLWPQVTEPYYLVPELQGAGGSPRYPQQAKIWIYQMSLSISHTGTQWWWHQRLQPAQGIFTTSRLGRHMGTDAIFFRWENWGTETLNSLPEVKRSDASSRSGFLIQNWSEAPQSKNHSCQFQVKNPFTEITPLGQLLAEMGLSLLKKYSCDLFQTVSPLPSRKAH